jgi:hypothetical protein
MYIFLGLNSNCEVASAVKYDRLDLIPRGGLLKLNTEIVKLSLALNVRYVVKIWGPLLRPIEGISWQ